jgi:hypothetical protein
MTRRGHEFDAIELVLNQWRDSGCLFLVAPATAGPRATGAVPAALDARFRGHDGEVGGCRTLEAFDESVVRDFLG